MLVAKITIGDWPNASPTPHSCHQYILYPTFITNIECNQNIRLIQWNREGQIYLDTDSSAGKDISTVAQIPTDLKCFTITNPHVSDPGGHFKMEIQFSDWLHEIDHSVHIWNGEQYTICYKSFPNTLKLIIQDSNFRSSFELLYKVNVLINSVLGQSWMNDSITETQTPLFSISKQRPEQSSLDLYVMQDKPIQVAVLVTIAALRKMRTRNVENIWQFSRSFMTIFSFLYHGEDWSWT